MPLPNSVFSDSGLDKVESAMGEQLEHAKQKRLYGDLSPRKWTVSAHLTQSQGHA